MLNTHKLLYILPDLSYVAELLPGKKELTFSIQSFRQINGEFLNENEILPGSVEKLFSKLEEEEYHLILPDFLFTNTIVNIEGTTKTVVLEHVEKKLLPELGLSKETHSIQTNVLTSFKGNSKVQISAIEKSVLGPIRAISQKSKAKITAISPLSWSVKAIISLEPSISVLQMGSNIYVAQHYIGVDQAVNFPLDKYDSIVETIKSLKGAEPSIQSVYLASSALVEEDLKNKLSGTLPIQQLASFKEDDSQMPSYIKFIIESTMRTLSIPDFPVPNFNLGKASEEELKSISVASAKSADTTKKDDTKNESNDLPAPTTTKEIEITEKIDKTVEIPPTDLPIPAVALNEKIAPIDKESDPMTQTTSDKNTENIESIEPLKEKEEDSKEKETLVDLPEIPSIDTTKSEEKEEAEVKDPKENNSEDKIDSKIIDNTDEEIQKDSKDNDIDLSKFASKDSDDEEEKEEKSDSLEAKKSSDSLTDSTNKSGKKIIKNTSGVNNMLKMVFITVAVFFITIAIGVGVGLGLLKMSDTTAEDTTPTIVSEAPEPTSTPEPTPEPVVINKEDLSILVVNATTKAGYAGKIKALLVAAEIENIDASNADGDYVDGTDYLLMLKENKDLQSLLEESTELTFEYSADIDVEDPSEEYDAVIVLAD
jgi:hypothetical protein